MKEIKHEEWRMNKCTHKETETIEVSGTDETITICHECSCEV